MKVLVMSSRIPFPLEKGDKLRLFHQLKHLSKEHEVILCCLSSKDASLEQKEALSPWVHELHVYRLSWMRRLWRMAWAWASDKPFQVVWFTEPRVQRQIRDLSVRCAPDVIYGQLVRCAEYVKDLHEVPKVLDYMDALSAGMHRRANNETRLFMKAYQWLLRTEGTRLARYESRVLDYFDGATIISRNDRLLIPHGDRDRIQLVPNGVDLSTFSPAESTPKAIPCSCSLETCRTPPTWMLPITWWSTSCLSSSTHASAWFSREPSPSQRASLGLPSGDRHGLGG